MEVIGPSGDRALVHDHRVYRLDGCTGEVVATPLDRSIVPLLEQIDSFATVENHTALLERYLRGSLSSTAIRGMLRELEHTGFLIGGKDLFVPTRETPEPIAFTGIATARPIGTVAPVVRSIVRELEQNTGTPLVISVQDAADSHALRTALVPEGTAVPVEILDREAFSRSLPSYLEDLPEQTASLIRRATGVETAPGFRAGANRNRLLLLGAGRRIVITDDDQPSRFTWAEAAPKLITSGFIPMEYIPLESIEERDRLVAFQPQDPAALHEPWLSSPATAGQPPPYGASIELNNLSRHMILALRNQTARVRTTMLGLAGDWGTRLPLVVAQSGPEAIRNCSLKRLLSAIGIVRTTAPVVTDKPLFRSSHCGYDNRECLPPFPASGGRNEDGVFGAALTRTSPPGAICHIPAAVEHYPKGEKTLSPDVLHDISLRLNDVLLVAILTSSPTTITGLGEYLNYLAALPTGTLVQTLLPHIWHQRSAMLERLTETIPIAHSEVQPHLEKAHRHILKQMEGDEFLESGVTWDEVRNHIAEYGQLLRIWPEIWERAANYQGQTSGGIII